MIATLRRDGGLYPLSALALILAGAIVFAAYWRLIGPTYLTAAAAPPQGEETRLLDAFSQSLAQGRRGLRLTVTTVDRLEEAAQRMETGASELAIVRPDVSLPANGLTVAILRQEAVIILHPAAQKLETVADLAGKTLAVLARDESDESAIRALLEFYDVAGSVRIERIEEDQAASALPRAKAAAAAFVATPGSPESSRVAKAIVNAFGKSVSLLDVAQADAFTASRPVFSAIKIPAGGVLASPVLPKEEATAVAVSWRLMARSGLDRGPISTLTERLFEGRTALARASRAANTMKAPEADDATSAVLPNHRGALDYFNREQLTFMDRYGDWLWFGLFAAGGVSSAFAWIGQLFTRRRREIIDDGMKRMCRILAEARKAETPEQLAELSLEIDRLVAVSVRRARRRDTNARTFGALTLAIDAARTAVRERREELREGMQPSPANPRLSREAKTASRGKS